MLTWGNLSNAAVDKVSRPRGERCAETSCKSFLVSHSCCCCCTQGDCPGVETFPSNSGDDVSAKGSDTLTNVTTLFSQTADDVVKMDVCSDHSWVYPTRRCPHRRYFCRRKSHSNSGPFQIRYLWHSSTHSAGVERQSPNLAGNLDKPFDIGRTAVFLRRI